MQIVIDIDENLYTRLFNIGDEDVEDMHRVCVAIRKGVPLPKEHGRLIDADELKKEYPHNTDWDYPVNTNCCVVESIDNSPTIIEADKEKNDG